MAFLFSRSSRQKSPQDLVRLLQDSLNRLEHSADKKKAIDEITRIVGQLKVLLNGDSDSDPSPNTIALLAQEVYSNDLLYYMIKALPRLDFELRKDFTVIFITILQRQIGQRFPTVEYLSTREKVIVLLVKGYENSDIALNCGQILRECIKHEQLAKIVLASELFWNFFQYVQYPAFEIASDAFSTFRELLTRHKSLALELLTRNTDLFFERFNGLLVSSNYVTKRQSIKLLGEILLDRTNYIIMTAYIDSPERLKLIMNMLRDKSRNIQYESFHVFKVFVANPHKSKPVIDILIKNQAKLLVFLPEFHSDRKNDDQFNDEKQFLIKQIQELQQDQIRS
ncbi:Mo25-like protein [Lipomyces japonicus]|uniref:Mo25-like protein n=1 Tax=Lipomyces japonicus TaxID=56871 RepID=UPI0034CF31F1